MSASCRCTWTDIILNRYGTMHQIESQGFAPIIADRASVLILGSLPGQRSLRDQQYYAHPQNAFWRIMGRMLGFDPASAYDDRCKSLQAQGVALWDVLASSLRTGSLDSAIDIDSARQNDFACLLKRHHGIKLIGFNGKKSRELFEKLVLRTVPAARSCRLVTLPSTSPAHAAMGFEDKLQQWLLLRAYIGLHQQEISK